MKPPGAWPTGILFLVLAVAGREPALAGTAPHLDVLPPAAAWHGRSLELLRAPEDLWATPFEASGGEDSPTYEETMAWLERLTAASASLRRVALGTSPEGRILWMIVASAEGAASPEALHANGRPTLLAQAGIHAGEIDGKDAGMMLLRDIAVGGRSDLLEGANFLFVPIFNVDGHERRSLYGRVNQRGPLHTGWRTTSANLNLNRDYAKLDTPEMRSLVTALNEWAPDLYLDLHVSDGADYRYDITFGFNGPPAWSPAIDGWLADAYTPAVAEGLRSMGHVPGPLVLGVDPLDLGKGIVGWTAGPRFSNGYGDARHLATVLVENHSLKPFRQRVLGTYVLLASSLEVLAVRGDGLRQATAQDRARRADPQTVAWKVGAGEPRRIPFLGIGSETLLSPVSGGLRLRWTGRPVDLELPVWAATEPAVQVGRPRAYWIPPAWSQVIDRLEVHGIRMERLEEPRQLEVQMYRLDEPELEPSPFEGHVRVTAATRTERHTETFPPGAVRVPTDQPLGDLAILLLEPEADDSFFRWGFFLAALQRTEYVEGYVMEPLAERMLASDPDLARAFRDKLASDADFRSDPQARLRWFYEKTPYFDPRWRLYPVAREP